jgi:hypothetical protein
MILLQILIDLLIEKFAGIERVPKRPWFYAILQCLPLKRGEPVFEKWLSILIFLTNCLSLDNN